MSLNYIKSVITIKMRFCVIKIIFEFLIRRGVRRRQGKPDLDLLRIKKLTIKLKRK